MKTTNTLTLLVFCCLLFSSKLINAQCHIDDWTALKALYEASSDGNWNNPVWEIIKTDEPPIDCNLADIPRLGLNSDGRIDSLNMGWFNYSGTLPPEIGGLKNLEFLSFSNNNLRGEMPSELWNLTKLRTLNFKETFLRGNIPSGIGNLINLIELDLFNNQLDGNIPSEVGNLINLTKLDFQYNRLNGSIPPEMGNLINLTELDFRNNQLSGNIPSELGNLINLTKLAFDNNQLSGNIPSELGSLTNLISLACHNNQLSGNIPTELGNLKKLKSLQLYDNQLDGSIPPELGNLINLEFLQLYDNQLNGSIPPELGEMLNLLYLELFNNQLSGNIPPELSNLNMLDILYLNDNQLSGNIPQELANLSLSILNLSNNQLNGSIPAGIGAYYLSLDNNQLSGNIPSEINAVGLSLSSNQLTGNIPIEFSNKEFDYLLLNNNKLSGNIPYLNPYFRDGLFESKYDIRFNNYSCSEIKNFNYEDFVYDEKGGLIVGSFFFYTPQNYDHSANKSFLIESSLEAISLNAPFNQTGDFSYQWNRNETLVKGATDTILVLNNVQFEDVGNYTLRITDDTCIEGLEYISDPISVRRTDLEGCTDINSCNYNEFAMVDDGSCEYLWCDTMANPIKIRTTNEVILSDTQIKFDLVIDSLGQDYSADGLTFTLDTRGNYRIESIEVINPTLSVAEIDISKLYKNILSINRINSQRLASGEPVLSATACVAVLDIPGDETTCSHFVISGGTKLSSGPFIDFDNVYIDIPFSDCSPYGGYGAEGENWLPLVLTISPQNCTTELFGFAEIKILEEGQSPFTYTLKNEDGNIILELTSEEKLIELPDLNAGNYELTVFDMSGKKTTMHTCIPLVNSLDGNETCQTNCIDYVTVPDGEINGAHYAKKEIEIKGFVRKDQTVEFGICE